MEATEQFRSRLDSFVAGAQAKINEHYKSENFPADHLSYEIKPSGKFVRVVKSGSCTRSVYCFVAIENGDVFKADSWKRPAKHARGNIYNPDNGLGGVTVYGGVYLK